MAKKESNVAAVLGLVAKADLTGLELFTSPNSREVHQRAESSNMQFRMMAREGKVSAFVGLDSLDVDLLKALDASGFSLVKRESGVDSRGLPKVPSTRANNSDPEKIRLGRIIFELKQNGRTWREIAESHKMAISTCHSYVKLYQSSGHKKSKKAKTPKKAKKARGSYVDLLPRVKKYLSAGKDWDWIANKLGVPKKNIQQSYYSQRYEKKKKRANK
jgi:hypothetical protein